MSRFEKILDERIQNRTELNLRRILKPACGIDFTSNDYLGFSKDADLRARFDQEEKKLPLSASGSRLLRGELPIYQEVEKVCAHFSKQESALLYPSGYQANVGIFSALLTAEDQVFSDELNHASIIDGMRLGKSQKFIYPHDNLSALEAMLEREPKPRGLRLIVTESIFSMDGSFARLPELVKLSEKYSANLVVDEAHATGLFRSGLVETQKLSSSVLATIHTGGKALGASGAWVAGSEKLRDYLIQYSRAFIYSTAPSPQQALLLKLSIEHFETVGESRAKELFLKINLFKDALKNDLDLPKQNTPILPIILGETKKTLRVAEAIQALGFDVRAIRPPTVSEGSSRLRVIIHQNQSDEDILALAHALKTILKKEVHA